jgi:hypothetical protein
MELGGWRNRIWDNLLLAVIPRSILLSTRCGTVDIALIERWPSARATRHDCGEGGVLIAQRPGRVRGRGTGGC